MTDLKVNKKSTVAATNEVRKNDQKAEVNAGKQEYTYAFEMQKTSGENALFYVRKGSLPGIFTDNKGVLEEFRGPKVTAETAKDLFTNVLLSINNPLGSDAESLSLSLEISRKNYTGEAACDKVTCDGILCDQICDGIVCDKICDGIVCDGIYCDKICDEIF